MARPILPACLVVLFPFELLAQSLKRMHHRSIFPLSLRTGGQISYSWFVYPISLRTGVSQCELRLMSCSAALPHVVGVHFDDPWLCAFSWLLLAEVYEHELRQAITLSADRGENAYTRG